MRSPRPPHPAVPGNLPAPVDRFVGRAAELAALERLLGEARLVTVTGIGGVGKSRLALRVAERAQDRFCGGVWLVELSAQRAGKRLVPTVVAALGLPDSSAQAPSAALARHFTEPAEAAALLVLDGCEHLVDECAELVGALLSRAPRLRVLVTSRRPLEAAGEHCFPLSPMVAETEAAELFTERAAAVLPGFAATARRQREAVAALCRRLDCLPLALELAAGALRALSVEQLLHRLDDRFRVLAGSGRGTLPRHQSMRTAIGWSHELCSPEERLLWARLSVFGGDFDLDAVEYLCSGSGLAGDEVLTALTGLVAQSVVIREEEAGQARYRLLATVREYGAYWLAELGETEWLRRRHRDWYLGLATWCELDWFGPRQTEVAARLDRELPNLRLALEYSLETPGDAHVGQYLSGALWFYWVGCGRLAEGQAWLDRALALDGEQPEARVKALWVAGLAAVARGEPVPALSLLHECVGLAEECGDHTAAAYATQMLGAAAMVSDDLPRAERLLRESLDRFGTLGELNALVLLAQVQLGLVLAFAGDLAGGEALCEEVREIAADAGEHWARSYALYVLAYVRWSRGEEEPARELLRECLALKRELHDVVGQTMALELLAPLMVGEEPELAARLLGAARTGWSSFGEERFGWRRLDPPHDACAERARGALGEAGYEEALRLGRGDGLETAVTQALSDEDEDANGPPGPRHPKTAEDQRAEHDELYVPPGQRA
ncbi:AAA family ATPase [Streptomyces sp. LX-29]|uniref:ATP-binding protein n=1 Tax=Streptomyces sp. LX-29 TaxID=2900152 RepID=UPI00240D15D3|nr:AAA family ATPase [Streptomyces sp. LX-29]WFB06557.1 AAA family ATPase [Streptomyces sp. LX-29]